MKIKRLTDCFLLLLAAGMLVACSSNDDNKENNGTDDGKKVNIAKAVTFKVDFADYNAEQEVGVTRAGNQEEKIGRQVIGLGNGILAQCTLQRDTTKQLQTIATRALPDDTYTMLAYDHTTHAFCGAMSGTVTGGAFAYTGNESMELVAGTYDFVLFNSKVSRSGNLLTVTRANAGDALIGRVTEHTITATPYHQTVNFTMKHVAAKVKVKLTGYMHFPAGIAATLASVNATDIPSSSIYDASTGTWSLGTGAATSDALTYGASQSGPYIPGKPYVYTISNEDAFFMPSTDVSKLKLTFTAGTIYNQNMAGANLTFAPKTPLQLDQNGSYVLNVNLIYHVLYLMSDGTTGFFEDTTFGGGTKTPIAWVLSQSKRIGIALKCASGGAEMYWRSPDVSLTTRDNTYAATSVTDAIEHAPSGLDETWNASCSVDGYVRGNMGNFYALYAAAHYDPGVTYTGATPLKWFLPSAKEVDEMLASNLFYSGKIDTGSSLIYKDRIGSYLQHFIFEQVGGQTFKITEECWTSTETIRGNRVGSVSFSISVLQIHRKSSKYNKLKVLPFVKY